MAPKETVWDLDPHTQAKHLILRNYLHAWFPILGSSKGLLYVDGFCGPGNYNGGEDGSPVIALKAAVTQQSFLKGAVQFCFLDKGKDRIEHLNSKLSEIAVPPSFQIKTATGEFDKEFGSILQTVPMDTAVFAFVDPFGFKGIPFNLIAELLKRPYCEVFINFMVEPINRWIKHPNEKVSGHIIDAFGTQECVRVAQEASDPFIDLRNLYASQLRRSAKFVRHFEMRNKQDKPLYYLFFASNGAKGHLKMKEAMWSVDPLGEFRFSDSTKPRQLVCYGDSVSNIADLRRLIRTQFGTSRLVSVANIEEFVQDQTPYLGSHMREALAAEEREGWAEVGAVKLTGGKRRAGSFPPDARITFLSQQRAAIAKIELVRQLSLFSQSSACQP